MAITQADVLKLAEELLAEWKQEFPGDPGNTLENALESAKAELNVKDLSLIPRGETKKERKKVERVHKVDEPKKLMVDGIVTALTAIEGVTMKEIKNEAEIHYTLDGVEYTIKLIKHRPPKK